MKLFKRQAIGFTLCNTTTSCMRTLVFIITFAFTFTDVALAQTGRWSFEIHGGLPYNIPAPLIIKQKNEETLRFNARYSSEPMIAPYYWVLRISRFQNNKSWEFEAIHHKLYLDNKPPEIQQFSISHGYNILVINRSFNKLAFQKHSFILRLGAGVVLSHPENKIRNKSLYQNGGVFDLGYYFTGPVLNISVAKRFYITNRLFVNTEIKFNPSVSWVPIVDGQAIVWNLPVTFIFGLGVDFIKETTSYNTSYSQ